LGSSQRQMKLSSTTASLCWLNLLACASSQQEGHDPDPISFWPLPTNVSFGDHGRQPVSSALTFTVDPANSDLQAYAERLASGTFATTAPSSEPKFGATKNVNVLVMDSSAPLALGVDESYTLEVPSGGGDATIAAKTIYGAMMGLQTLAQAVRYSFEDGCYGVAGAPLAITDAPRFGWRGVLVDSDRHWLSASALRSVVDSMGYSKLNVLHWHPADWQAWPLESKALPNLWEASWSTRERYTLADVAALVAYGARRGVRVMVELDTPGHASSMCFAYPELCCDSEGCGSGRNSPLTPVPNPDTGEPTALNAIKSVLGELASVASDGFFHLGGDIVGTNVTCWELTPSVQAWMAEQGFTSTDQVYGYFVNQVNQMALDLGRIPVRWEEVWTYFGTALDQATVIHAWLSRETVVNATSHGYRAIWSVSEEYYLDYLDTTWETFYDVDLLEGVSEGGAAQEALVLGGQTEMWGEVADGSNFLQTIWPRAAAAAERQWSYDVVTTSDAPGVVERLQQFRCFLLERGIPAAPVGNAQARGAPAGPGSCTQ